MNLDRKYTSNRLYFMDNLRAIIIILVLIFHAGASYSSTVVFWPFHDSNYSGLIDIFMFLGDVFMMTILFFIAGYFALPSIRKRNSRDFLLVKFKVLLIPWLIVTVGILPILDYIHSTTQYSRRINFGNYWLKSMKKISEFYFGWLDMNSYRPMIEHYYQRYVWFISLLLLFFVIFTIIWELNKRIKLSCKVSLKSNYVSFIIVGILSVISFAIVKLFVYQDILGSGWFSLGNLFQFQLGKVFIYAIYFLFGVYAYSNKWFAEKNKEYGSWWIWGISCFILFGVNMLVFKN